MYNAANGLWIMSLPFTIEQFLGVFAAYNAAIWPAPIFAYVLGLVAGVALWLEPIRRHAEERRRLARRWGPALASSLIWSGRAPTYPFGL